MSKHPEYYYDEELVVHPCDFETYLRWYETRPHHVLEQRELTHGASNWRLQIEFCTWASKPDLAGDLRFWEVAAYEITTDRGTHERYSKRFTDFSEAQDVLERIEERIKSGAAAEETGS